MEKIYRYPWVIVLVIAVITVFFAFQLPRLELDNNNFRFISENDPARLVLRHIDDTFGTSIFILVALERRYGTVFDPVFLSLVRGYVEKIEDIKTVDPVTSIVNAEYITGDSESIRVEKLLNDDFSGTAEEIARLKEKLLSWDMYKCTLISDDFSSTQILVPLSISAEEAGTPEAINSFIQVRDIAREMFNGAAEVYVTGIPVISATINEAMQADLALLVPLVIIVVLLILFLSFRRLSCVILPLFAVMISAVWTMGAVSLFGVKLSVVSTVLPVILVAVGSAYGIHVITRFLEVEGNREPDRKQDRELYRESVAASVTIVARPVFLAAMTTLAGFMSFCFTTVLPIREFGIFACFGVFASFAVALTLIPALLIIAGPPKNPGKTKKNGNDRFGNAVSSFFLNIALHKNTVLFTAGIVLVVSVIGASRLVIDNVFIEYFKPSTDIAKSDNFVREKFGGSKIISVVAEAETSDSLLHPESLLAMDGLNSFLENKVPEAGKTNGFTDLVKRINQVFNADESPDGIQVSPYLASLADDESWGSADDFGFGFDGEDFGFNGEDFGFDDFGFDDGGVLNHVPAETALSRPVYTADDVITLLSKAARSGNSADPGAAELVEEVKKLVNYEGAAYYEIPSNPAKYGKTRPEELTGLVSNYLILLSGNIGSYANDPLEPTAIKTTVQLRTVGETDTNRAVDAINAYTKENFPSDIKVTIGGSAMVESSLNRHVVNSQIISLFISLALVFFIISFSNRSPAAGVIGIISLAVSILINFAVMGFLGIKLNLGTSMIASLAVGIGIDYTIHYMEAFKREQFGTAFTLLPAEEKRKLLAGTFAVSGKAIIINALSVGAGFAVLLLSNFIMLGDFGLLIAVTMGVSAFVSLTVIPALLLTFKPAFAYVTDQNNIEKGETA